MFKNIFSNNSNFDSPTAGESLQPDAESGETPRTVASAEEIQAWQLRIQATATDDDALLQLAQQAPTLALKLATIEALRQERSLKQAMHDFRDQDKRLYRAAKSRYETATATRLANQGARALIAGASALRQRENVSVSSVMELNRAWAALNVVLIEAALIDEFNALSEHLGGRVRAHSERAQTLTRWLSAVDVCMDQLKSELPGVAQGDIATTGAQTLAVNVLELVQNPPDTGDARCIEKTDAGNRLLALASSVVERADFLKSLTALPAADEAAEKACIAQWREFPEITDGELHTVLAHRFADWRNSNSGQRQLEHDALSARERVQREQKYQQRVDAVVHDIEAAEAAQAAGHLADLTRLLDAIDHALIRGPANAALTPRIDALRREQRRLHEWQRWSGGQGRERLAAEAQVLALQAAGKVAINAHVEAITKLRERWKELDKLGGASNQAVWLAFDGALKAAYVPVAAHLDKLKMARQENLAAREAIVATLVQAAAAFFPDAPDGAAPVPVPDWRALARTLDDAQLAWRKLGPVEHTVPRKALKGDNALTERYSVALQALLTPLKTAHGEARSRREALVAAAKTLAASDVTARDVIDKVRKLQSQWQAEAKALSLPRRDENALWGAFKTATDAIFTTRDASRAAVEAESSSRQKAREDIIEKLTALTQATVATDIKRAMAAADTAWRACPDAPGAQAARLDKRYRAARDAVTRRLDELAAHASQARYDALIAKIALCEERERLLDTHDSNGTLAEEQAVSLEARWNAIEQFPDAWKSKLDARFAGLGPTTAAAAKPGKNTSEGLSDILLNLEVAYGMESPAEFLAARQHLKIRALKNAMEGRQAVQTTSADIERWLLDATAFARPDETSRARLMKIIAAVRVRRPG